MTQIRLQPVVVQNVTTYGTVITVPNRELKLKPGMTANVKIEIAKRTNALAHSECGAAIPADRQNVRGAAIRTPPPEVTQAFGGRGGRGGRGGGFGRGGAGNAAPQQRASPAAAAPGAATASPRAPRSADAAQARWPQGRRGGTGGGSRRSPAVAASGGFGGAAGGRGGPEFQARMLERFKTMSPEEQQQFLARMKERGGDTSAFEAARHSRRRSARRPRQRASATIDALFAPLPVVESRGRAWLFIDNQLKPVTLRLGISDGTYTELISDELQDNTEVVTGVTGLSTSTRGTPTQSGTRQSADAGPRRGGPGGGGQDAAAVA